MGTPVAAVNDVDITAAERLQDSVLCGLPTNYCVSSELDRYVIRHAFKPERTKLFKLFFLLSNYYRSIIFFEDGDKTPFTFFHFHLGTISIEITIEINSECRDSNLQL